MLVSRWYNAVDTQLASKRRLSREILLHSAGYNNSARSRYRLQWKSCTHCECSYERFVIRLPPHLLWDTNYWLHALLSTCRSIVIQWTRAEICISARCIIHIIQSVSASYRSNIRNAVIFARRTALNYMGRL